MLPLLPERRRAAPLLLYYYHNCRCHSIDSRPPQYPFKAKKIAMLVGGTGITPMVQALHAILGTAGDPTERVSVLYGSRSADDILAKSVLDEWEKGSDRLDVTHVLSAEPEGSAWTGARGFIDEALCRAKLPPPGDDVLIFVCGPPPMYAALCGPRGDDAPFEGLLADMGYAADSVYKF